MGLGLKFLVGCCVVPLFASVGLAAAAGGLSLVSAAKEGDRDAVVSLLRGGVDANSPAGDGTTALFWAAYANDAEMAEALLASGADVNRANEYGATALYVAAVNADETLIEKLLEAAANPDATLLSGETPLMGAINRGRVQAVNLLLSGGADPNAKETKHGQTALMWAAAERHSAVTKILIEHGADVSARSIGGFTALMFAAQQGDVESGRALLAAGADVNELMPGTEVTPLLIASAGRHEDFVALLLDHNADFNAVDANGFTSLHHAAWNRNGVDIVTLLLAHGADPNVRLWQERRNAYTDTGVGLQGATPFLLAAEISSLGALRALVDAGADPLISTEQTTTPLILAAGGGTDFARPRSPEEQEDALETVELLVELGVDVNAAGEFGWTALHAASYQGLNDVIQFLASKGATLDAMDGFGQTALSISYAVITEGIGDAYDQSARSFRRDTADLLLALGATPLEESGVIVVLQKASE